MSRPNQENPPFYTIDRVLGCYHIVRMDYSSSRDEYHMVKSIQLQTATVEGAIALAKMHASSDKIEFRQPNWVGAE